MPEFIGPVVAAAISILETYTPALLAAAARDPFAEYGRAFTGVVANTPAVYVMPVRTSFDADIQGCFGELHQITIKFAVTGSDPEDLADAALAYMKAIDEAIQQATGADWGTAASRVFIQGHDYGPLYERGGSYAKFPELELIVEAQEAL